MDEFNEHGADVEEFLAKCKKVSKGMTPTEAGIEPAWLVAYASVARRCRDDKELGLSRYPYEAGPTLQAFDGGFFPHRDWGLRRGMERHSSMRAVCEYETNYINAVGYWLAFQQAAFALRQEALADKKYPEASKFDCWMTVAGRYGLRVVGLRSEFYKMAADDPTYAKLVITTLEKRSDVVASEDLVEAMDKLDINMSTQLMKAVATLSASNATKRAGKGGAAKDQ